LIPHIRGSTKPERRVTVFSFGPASAKASTMLFTMEQKPVTWDPA
jgi:hypothetical protein